MPRWLEAFLLSVLMGPDGYVRKAGNRLETTLTGPGSAPTTLDGLSDVVAPAPTAGQVLRFGGATWGPV